MIRRPPRSTLDRSSAASDVYKRQARDGLAEVMNFFGLVTGSLGKIALDIMMMASTEFGEVYELSLIHISEPTRPY